jgi:hypothetical protein
MYNCMVCPSSFNCGHGIVCPSSFLLWSLYCLSFVLFIVVIALSVLRPFYCGHCIVCPLSILLWSLHGLSFVLFTDHAMTTIKRTKDRQYNDHNKKGQRTDNTKTTIKRTKDRQYHDHNEITKDRQCNDHNKKDEGQKIQIVCPSFFLLWYLYCLSFVLFYCGHCIVCPSSFLLWSLHGLSDHNERTKDRPCNDHNKKDEGRTMQ